MEALADEAALHVHGTGKHGVNLVSQGALLQLFECEVPGHDRFGG